MQNIDLTEKSGHKKHRHIKHIEHIKHKNLFPYIKTGKEILTFGDIEIEKDRFYCYKILTFLEDRY